MKKVRRFAPAGAVLIISLLLAIAAASGQQAETDAVLKAMQDELARSVAQLQLKDLEKPYFIEYAVVEDESFSASATFGALVRSNRNRNRALQVQVRVGGYDFDNTDFISSSALFSPTSFPTTVSVEDDYNALRRDLWLTTDAAYKQAVEQLARKRAFVQNKVEEEKVPDFSREQAAATLAPRQQLQIDQARWEKQLREWSNIFRQFPAVQESSVTLRVQLTHKYLLNSEGTKTRQPAPLVSLEARAATQAPDGMRLRHSIPFYARSLDQLPPAQEIARAIRQMAEELTGLRTAPVLESNYSGPVLFISQASAEMFAQLLAPQLSGQRPPLAEQQQFAAMMGATKSELADRLNRPVLPSFISVFDDPAQQANGNQPLIGAYQADDQGVPARRVSLIEQGTLKGLLMSRRPRKEMAQSNGHGRAASLGSASAQIGNLFVQASGGKSEAELKQELIKMCKSQNLPFGILIKTISAPGSAGRDGSEGLIIISSDGPRREALSAPVLAFKVYAEDGREELIRGVMAGDISVRALKQITAAGSTGFVHNRLTSGGSPFSLGGAIPTSVIAPSVLVEEMEFKRPSDAKQKPALLSHPYFTK